MKRFKLNENDITRIVKQVLNEGISIPFETISDNFPDNLQGPDFFSTIIPEIYQQAPNEFVNACATRMSFALNNAGYKPTPIAFNTLSDYSGAVGKGGKQLTLKKGSPLITSAVQMKTYLRSTFGKPTFEMSNDDKQKVLDALGDSKGVFVLTNVPGWRASGHAEIYRGNGECGNLCHFGEGGTLTFWGMKTQAQLNAVKCGWGNDVEGYKNSNWRCYDVEMTQGKSYPAKNAKKCGYGDDVKAYRKSGWKCKN